ncbi:MAG: glycosyltransferase [Firmicutes bacterium]|nr:glycosyltransferase [Bacillota bacterium]MDY6161015.1 glycosyltransferase [Candidatus Faecousia sp.]
MTFIDALSLYAIISIWLLMIMNAVLSIGGFIYYMKVEKQGRGKPLEEYPTVSILVPAHNEALVIVRTVRALLNMEYPVDRYEVIVINDNSTDDTAEKLEELQREFPDRRLIVISTGPEVGGKGKSNALNIGFSVSTGEVIAIYDADNTPESDALAILVENLMEDDKIGAVIGKFRTRNRNASLLSRFVNIETLAYQCMNQAGRYFFFKLCTIPGTNYVIRRKLIEEIGGWDTKALSEDTEISFRLYRMGYYIKQMPLAVTWEQEPHLLSVWFRQRTRWAKGNIYVLVKNMRYIFDPTAGPMRLDVIYYLIVYILMLSSLVISDYIFISGILGLVHVTLGGFSTLLWGMAILVFVFNMMLTLSTEKNEFTLNSALLVLLMLFTYAKLWVFVVLKALWLSFEDQVFHKEVKWDKTVRYEEETETSEEEAALQEELLHKKGR